MLSAALEERANDGRKRQKLVGPSSIGFCRELLRADLFEPDVEREPESHWAVAAHIGTVMGDRLETIFGERLNAVAQNRITTWLEELGFAISGAMDLVFVGADQVSDLKSTADMGGVLSDLNSDAAKIERLLAIKDKGRLYNDWEPAYDSDGNEIWVEGVQIMREQTDEILKWVAKLSYYCQIAVYVMGAIQSGLIDENGTGRLVFYDRSGDYQEFVAVVIDNRMIDLFFAIAQHRVRQVVDAQKALDAGDPSLRHALRDKSPSFCFSSKVMCGRRMHCWGGSDWAPSQTEITDAEYIRATEHYVEGHALEKLGKGMKEAARSLLRGDGTEATRIQGTTPDGVMVSWVRGGSTINVVETVPRKVGTDADA